MSKAKITLIGMYQWMHDNNDDLFANLSTPTGIDKDKLVSTILMNGAEFEVLYADADYFKFLIGVWSDKWQRTMEKWIAALSINYNPLENYDRMEDWQDTTNRMNSSLNSNSHNDGSTKVETIGRKEIAMGNDISKATGDGTNVNEVSACDSSTFVNHDKTTSNTSGTNNASSVTDASGKTDSVLIDQASGSSDDTGTNVGLEDAKRTGRAHGNIGVTTSQQMLEAELDISKFNLYDEISNLFLTEFVVYTY